MDARVLKGLLLSGVALLAVVTSPGRALAGGSWVPTTPLSTPRCSPLAAALPTGEILVTGGTQGAQEMGVCGGQNDTSCASWGPGIQLTSSEIYDPVTRTWTAAAPSLGPHAATALTLHDGRVLLADGNPEAYDPSAGTWSPITASPSPVSGNPVVLSTGKVLFPGGPVLLYDPEADAWHASAAPIPAGGYTDAIELPDGRVFVVNMSSASTSGIYDPAADTIQPTSAPPVSFFSIYAPWPLPDGRVFFPSDNIKFSSYTHSCDTCSLIYDPISDTWEAAPSIPRTLSLQPYGWVSQDWRWVTGSSSGPLPGARCSSPQG